MNHFKFYQTENTEEQNNSIDTHAYILYIDKYIYVQQVVDTYATKTTNQQLENEIQEVKKY